MECKRAMELITQFINGQLEPKDTEAFLNHIDGCPECREELEVMYSLMTAMRQLDEDADLSDNYIEELNNKIEICYLDELKRRRSCARRRVLFGVVVALLVFLTGITADNEWEEADRRLFTRLTGEKSVEQEYENMTVEKNNGDTETDFSLEDEE